MSGDENKTNATSTDKRPEWRKQMDERLKFVELTALRLKARAAAARRA